MSYYKAYEEIRNRLNGKSVMFLAPLLEQARKQEISTSEGEAGKAVMSAVTTALAEALRKRSEKLTTTAVVEAVRSTYELHGWVIEDHTSFDSILVHAYLDALEVRHDLSDAIEKHLDNMVDDNAPVSEANRAWFKFMSEHALAAAAE